MWEALGAALDLGRYFGAARVEDGHGNGSDRVEELADPGKSYQVSLSWCHFHFLSHLRH